MRFVRKFIEASPFDRIYGLKIRSTSTETVSHGRLEQYVWAASAARSF